MLLMLGIIMFLLGMLSDQFFIYTWNSRIAFEKIVCRFARCLHTKHGFLMFILPALFFFFIHLNSATNVHFVLVVFFLQPRSFFLIFSYVNSFISSQHTSPMLARRGEKNNSESKNWQRTSTHTIKVEFQKKKKNYTQFFSLHFTGISSQSEGWVKDHSHIDRRCCCPADEGEKSNSWILLFSKLSYREWDFKKFRTQWIQLSTLYWLHFFEFILISRKLWFFFSSSSLEFESGCWFNIFIYSLHCWHSLYVLTTITQSSGAHRSRFNTPSNTFLFRYINSAQPIKQREPSWQSFFFFVVFFSLPFTTPTAMQWAHRAEIQEPQPSEISFTKRFSDFP